MNAVGIEQAVSDLFEQPFDPEEFFYQFLEAFGNKSTTNTVPREVRTKDRDIGFAVV